MDKIFHSENINVCYSLYDKSGAYSKLAGVAMTSMFENTRQTCHIHLLHDNTLTKENREKFIKLIRLYGQQISFYNVEEMLPELFAKIPAGGRFSKAAMYRLLIGQLLPNDIKRVVYLDTDTVLTSDIGELWQEETGENGLAAVSELELTYGNMIEKSICVNGFVKKDRYFCSGVLLIDMEKFKRFDNLLLNGLELLAQHPDWWCHDQDILNYCFASSYKKLPIKYDIFVAAERLVGNQNLIRGIYHYAGKQIDPFDGKDIYNRLWFRYFIKSPWFDEEMLFKIFSLASWGYDNCRQNMRGLFNDIWGMRRVFIGYATNEAMVRASFSIKENERYITLVEQTMTDIIDRLTDEINRLSPDEIAFLCVARYPEISAALIQRGLKERINFINCVPLLSLTNAENRPIDKSIFDAL